MSQSSRDDKAQVALAFAADYLEVLATARSARLLPARRSLVALVRKTAAARVHIAAQGESRVQQERLTAFCFVVQSHADDIPPIGRNGACGS
jgi:hypothetical protein